MMWCVVKQTMDDDGFISTVAVIGPFTTEDAAYAWGREEALWFEVYRIEEPN